MKFLFYDNAFEIDDVVDESRQLDEWRLIEANFVSAEEMDEWK